MSIECYSQGNNVAFPTMRIEAHTDTKNASGVCINTKWQAGSY